MLPAVANLSLTALSRSYSVSCAGVSFSSSASLFAPFLLLLPPLELLLLLLEPPPPPPPPPYMVRRVISASSSPGSNGGVVAAASLRKEKAFGVSPYVVNTPFEVVICSGCSSSSGAPAACRMRAFQNLSLFRHDLPFPKTEYVAARGCLDRSCLLCDPTGGGKGKGSWLAGGLVARV